MARRRFWFAVMGRGERATWLGCFGGRVLDAMDAQIYALILPSLMLQFHLSHAEAGLLGGLLSTFSVATTLLAGMAADRFGRLRVLQAAIAVAAVATLLSAFAQSFTTLAILRAVQAMGYGAEMVASAALVAEVVNQTYRARALAAVQSGYALGYFLALMGTVAIDTLAPSAEAWRYLFALGLVPLGYVAVLQRTMIESPLFVAQRARGVTDARRSTALDLLRGHNGRNVLLTGMIAVGVFGASQLIMFWLPTYLRHSLGLNVRTSALYLSLNIAGSFFGPLIYGPLSDRFGRRPVFLVFLGLQAGVIGLFLGTTMSLVLAAGFGLLVGLLQGGLATGVHPIIAELFGTDLRARAFGVNGAIIRGIGALAPTIVGLAAQDLPLGTAMCGTAIGFYAVAVTGILLVRETKGESMATSLSAQDGAPRTCTPIPSVAPGATTCVGDAAPEMTPARCSDRISRSFRRA